MQKTLLVCGLLSLAQAVEINTQAEAGSELEAWTECQSEAQTAIEKKSGCPYCKKCKKSKSKRPVLTSVMKGQKLKGRFMKSLCGLRCDPKTGKCHWRGGLCGKGYQNQKV